MANANTINNLKDWFNHTLVWLNVDRSTGSLQRPHQQMLDLMQKARVENHPNDVWEIIQQLEELTIQAGIQEQGEIFLNCAKMAGDLENMREAMRLCSAAESKFRSYPHHHGVSLWMLGCIQWASHQRVKAISSWREAIQTFKSRQSSLQLDSKRVVWYNQMLPKLEIYLDKAIENDELPDYEDDLIPEPTQQTSSSTSSVDALKWTSIPVSDTIPAGGFSAVGYDPKQTQLSATEILIENERYSVHSTKRKSLWQNSVIISQGELYHTARVSGNSMNNAKPVAIEHGDYILIRLQNNAEDNEIVVANLNDPTPRATVKRISISGGRITLHPESLDPNIQNDPDFEREYSPREIRISGVVEAVFKKKG